MVSKRIIAAAFCVLMILSAGAIIAAETGDDNAQGCIQDHLHCVEDTPENRLAAAREYFAAGQQCYTQFARCERQQTGACGWTPVSAELDDCLAREAP